MINDPLLINDWLPVATVKQLEENNLVSRQALGRGSGIVAS